MDMHERVPVDGNEMKIRVGVPDGAGPHPAILLAFHRHGFSPFTADVIEEFSRAGYVIAVPDLYHRCGDVTSDEAVKHRRDDHVLADMSAGHAYLTGHKSVDRERIVVAGHCMGGRIAFLTACAMPDAFRACLSYYSGGMFQPWGDGPSPFDRLSSIRCPVAGFFGNDDDNPPPAEVDRIGQALARTGVRFEIHRYDGAGHGYMDRNRGRFKPEATRDSWSRSYAFLAELGLAPEPRRVAAAGRR